MASDSAMASLMVSFSPSDQALSKSARSNAAHRRQSHSVLVAAHVRGFPYAPVCACPGSACARMASRA